MRKLVSFHEKSAKEVSGLFDKTAGVVVPTEYNIDWIYIGLQIEVSLICYNLQLSLISNRKIE